MRANKIIFLLTSTILFISCFQSNRSDAIERKGLNSDTKNYMILNNAENDTIWYPDLLNVNKKYIFHDEEGNSLQIQRTGNMILKFQLKSDNDFRTFEASLLPSFYFGMETIEAEGGEYIIDEYHIKNKEDKCIASIGIGNQNVAESNTIATYAILKLKSGCNETPLIQMKRKLFRLKAIID